MATPTPTLSVPSYGLTVLLGPLEAPLRDWLERWTQPDEVLTDLEPLPRRLEERRWTLLALPAIDPSTQRQLRRLAKTYHAPCAAWLVDDGSPRASSMLPQQTRRLERDGFSPVITLTPSRLASQAVERQRSPHDRRELTGPFDIIGDLHGCAAELEELLERLGYTADGHPEQRYLVFLGDLTDRGPESLRCYRIVADRIAANQALCVKGNHDAKLLRYLEGKAVTVSHGMETTVGELETRDSEYRARFAAFLRSLPSHYLLDEGRLVVAHAGIQESHQGRCSPRVQSFCLYGDTTGELDSHGLPVRRDWARHYRGQALVVYGHTPVREPRWIQRTVNIDTGCVFGGRLTALRYPELTCLSVASRRCYWSSPRPLA